MIQYLVQAVFILAYVVATVLLVAFLWRAAPATVRKNLADVLERERLRLPPETIAVVERRLILSTRLTTTVRVPLYIATCGLFGSATGGGGAGYLVAAVGCLTASEVLTNVVTGVAFAATGRRRSSTSRIVASRRRDRARYLSKADRIVRAGSIVVIILIAGVGTAGLVARSPSTAWQIASVIAYLGLGVTLTTMAVEHRVLRSPARATSDAEALGNDIVTAHAVHTFGQTPATFVLGLLVFVSWFIFAARELLDSSVLSHAPSSSVCLLVIACSLGLAWLLGIGRGSVWSVARSYDCARFDPETDRAVL